MKRTCFKDLSIGTVFRDGFDKKIYVIASQPMMEPSGTRPIVEIACVISGACEVVEYWWGYLSEMELL